MLIGVPKEIRVHEYRVGLVPASIHELVVSGHEVLVQSGAGVGLGISDNQYEKAGAVIGDAPADVFEKAEMIVKVKEPQAEERKRLQPDQILFTYLHLAPDPEQTKKLLASGAVCIAYETLTSALGGLPLLAPMSEFAGRMAIQAEAHCLEKEQGGMGTLLCGVPGVAPGKIVIIGGGVVGANATKVAVGIGAEVVVIDRSNEVLRHLDEVYGSSIKTIISTYLSIEQHVRSADLVIGAVLIPGAVARTSTFALNNATLPFVKAIADKGYRQAMLDDPHLGNGLNIHGGKITCEGVATALDYEFVDPFDTLGV
jgi:alanine dehydrogenase